MSSETLTQTLARNPMLGANLAAADALPLLDASGTGIGKDAAILLSELRKAISTYNAQSSSSGDLTVSPGVLSLQHTEVLTLSGTARTTKIVLDTANSPATGSRIVLRLNLPAVASILLDFRNASTTGTQITTYSTDGSGDDAVIEFYFDGTAWQFLSAAIPANA